MPNASQHQVNLKDEGHEADEACEKKEKERKKKKKESASIRDAEPG
jgi:hypothetical protein